MKIWGKTIWIPRQVLNQNQVSVVANLVTVSSLIFGLDLKY